MFMPRSCSRPGAKRAVTRQRRLCRRHGTDPSDTHYFLETCRGLSIVAHTAVDVDGLAGDIGSGV